MRKIFVCFIILHYVDYQMTKTCVNSLLALDCNENTEILIVDNASPNDSGVRLAKSYEKIKNVTVLVSNDNVGFSKGNNIAYEYYKKNFISDFLIACNNDIVIEQKDFLVLLKRKYDEEPFFVAGPDIFVPHCFLHQNPVHVSNRTPQEVNILINKNKKICYKLSKKISLIGLKMYVRENSRSNYIFYLCLVIKNLLKKFRKNLVIEVNDVMLHGAFLIFTKDYIMSNEKYLFRPYTFLYAEEDFLCLLCRRRGWKTKYIPSLKVTHFCHSSFNYNRVSYREFCNKMIQTYKSYNIAFEKYIELYKTIE